MKPSRQVIRAWKRFVFANPWQGDQPLNDRRHFLDTYALLEPDRPLRVLLRFDIGYHNSGWFANSEWEQNLHLSLSHPMIDKPKIWTPAKPEIQLAAGLKKQLETVSDQEAREWGKLIFGDNAPMAWFEPAVSVFDQYRAPNVVHLRLFYDQNMQPFIPKGEPYELKPWVDGSSPEKVYGRNRAT